MNIEEKNISSSIKSAKNKLFHFHVAENDRGIPGSGTLDFDSIFKTLKEINYSANVTLEMFIQANKQTSKDLFTWRDIEVDPYKAIKDSHLFLNKYF
jgi:D-psicose/D-tagatose/L-ribulose 3-epimerase